MISVITCTIRDHLMEQVFENYESQVWKEKELIIVLNKDDMNIGKWKERAEKSENVTVYQLPEEASVGQCQNFAVSKATYDIIAKFDDDDYYSPYYLKSQIKAFFTTDASIVGKRDCFYYLEGEKKLLQTHLKGHNQNTFVQKVTDSSLMFYKSLLDKVTFPDDAVNFDTLFQKECVRKGYKIYSTDKYNFVVIRRANVKSHTWQVKNWEVKNFTKEIAKTEDFKSYVTRPE